MVTDTWLCHVEAISNLAGCHIALLEHLQNLSSGGIIQRFK
jgi:hypothetical protein